MAMLLTQAPMMAAVATVDMNKLFVHDDDTNGDLQNIRHQISQLSADQRIKRDGILKTLRTQDQRVKTLVEVSIIFNKIGEIDTLKENYSADVTIQARWQEPALDGLNEDELRTIDLSQCWNPSLYINNILSESKDSTTRSATVNEDGRAFIFERRKLRGVFYENLELETFPFDLQELSVTVISERPESELEIIPFDENPSSVNTGTFTGAQEWRLYEHVEVTQKQVEIEYASHVRHHSAIQVTACASRRPGFFIYNIYFVVFLIISMSFVTFAIDCKLVQNRINVCFTLLLTSIAFKMVVNSSLPKISYLTYMDRYMLQSLVFLIMVTIWHAISPLTVCTDATSLNRTSNGNLENYVLLGFFILHLSGHAVFITIVYLNAWSRHVEMARREKELAEIKVTHG